MPGIPLGPHFVNLKAANTTLWRKAAPKGLLKKSSSSSKSSFSFRFLHDCIVELGTSSKFATSRFDLLLSFKAKISSNAIILLVITLCERFILERFFLAFSDELLNNISIESMFCFFYGYRNYKH